MQKKTAIGILIATLAAVLGIIGTTFLITLRSMASIISVVHGSSH